MLFASALAALALVIGGGSPFSGGPVVTDPITSFRAELRSPFGVSSVVWAEPDRLAIGSARADDFFVVEDGGTRTYGAEEEDFDGQVATSSFAAEPDADSELRQLPSAEYALARSRGGKPTLVPVQLGTVQALRASYRLAANDCAGLAAGVGQIYLDLQTLLPIRYEERRGRRTRTWRLTYRDVNAEPAAGAFDPPPVGPGVSRTNVGFRRATPAEAAANLSYVPQLPTRLPPGFELAVSGWAKRGLLTGAEGSNPRHREVFAAVFTRGFEHVDVTMRLATTRDRGNWLNDPFGVECGFQFTQRADVDGASAVYGTGPTITPHLYWRRGRLLFTVSGPFPKRDLVVIAESLAPATS